MRSGRWPSFRALFFQPQMSYSLLRLCLLILTFLTLDQKEAPLGGDWLGIHTL